MPEETKRKLRDANVGRKRSAATRARMRLGQKERRQREAAERAGLKLDLQQEFRIALLNYWRAVDKYGSHNAVRYRVTLLLEAVEALLDEAREVAKQG
jgi:hypothetical protein